MIRRPPRSTHCISSAASDVYKRQILDSPLRFGVKVKINVALADFDIAELIGWPVWEVNSNIYGFNLDSWSQNWEDFVKSLEAELNQSTEVGTNTKISA